MPESKVYAKRLVKGSAIVFTSLIATELVAFLLRMFLARSLSVAEYGLFYAVFTVFSFFGLFRGLGFGSALTKYVPEFAVKKQYDKLKSSIAFTIAIHAVVSLLIVFMIFVFSGEIASGFFETGAAVPILQILAIWFFVTIFLLFLNVFQGFQNMQVYAVLQFLRYLLIFLLALLFVGYFGLGIKGAAFAYLFEISIIAVLAFAILKHQYPFIFKAKTSVTKPLIKKLSVFALPVILGSIGGLVITYMDTLMITGLRSLSEVGLYQAARPISNFLWYFPAALGTILFPMVSELYAKRASRLLGRILHFLVKFSFIVIVPAAIVFIAFPETIINLFFGPGYLGAATTFQILSAAAIAYTFFEILAVTVEGIGKPLVSTKVVAVMAVFNLFGNLALIPPYGIEGAAVATLISYIVGVVLLFSYTKKLVKFRIPLSSLSKTICGGVLTLILIAGLKYVLELPPWPEAFVVMIPSLLFYGAWILMTKAVTTDDLRLIARIVPIPKWLVKFANKLVKS